ASDLPNRARTAPPRVRLRMMTPAITTAGARSVASAVAVPLRLVGQFDPSELPRGAAACFLRRRALGRLRQACRAGAFDRGADGLGQGLDVRLGGGVPQGEAEGAAGQFGGR